MKVLTSVLLTVTFVLYLGGIQLFYWVRIDSARHNAAVRMQDKGAANNTLELTYTNKQYDKLQWLEKNKEFIYNGQRYDISSIKYTSTGVVLKCYHDNEETEIAEAFEHFASKLFNGHQANQTSNGDIIAKITKEYLPLDFKMTQNRVGGRIYFIIAQQYPLRYSPISDIWHPPATC